MLIREENLNIEGRDTPAGIKAEFNIRIYKC